MNAAYHAIPQAPVAANPISLAAEDVEEDELLESSADIAPIVTTEDSRIRWIHFILGCAVLLPWNALITATPYFQSRLTGSALKSTFSSYLSTSFTAVNFAVLAHATATSKHTSHTRRVLFSLIWLALLTFTLTISTYMHLPPSVFFAFVLINAVGQASAGSYLQTAVIAVASLFGHTAMQSVMTGQAAVGVVVSGVQVLSAAASMRSAGSGQVVITSEPEEQSAFIFFGLSTVFLLVTIGVHAWLVSLPDYKALAQRRSLATHSAELTSTEDLDEAGAFLASDADAGRSHGKHFMLRMTKTNAEFNIAVSYVFIVTLAVFPPITVSVQPVNTSIHPLLFTAVHFLVFNVGDFTGRSLCSFSQLHIWSARRLLTLSLLRTLFIPLFLMCNINGIASQPSSRGPLINSDVLFMLILLFFGMSNGYVSSMCMMSAPSITHNPRLRGRMEDVDVAATVASFCLVGGLAIGSIASFAVRAAVCDCNPFRE